MEKLEESKDVGEDNKERAEEEIEIDIDDTIEPVASGSREDDDSNNQKLNDSDIIDLRPNSDTEDSEDDDDDVEDTPALFKKRKLSNSRRNYRSNNNKSLENDTSGSSSKDDTNEDIVVDDAEPVENVNNSDAGPPNLVNSSDNSEDEDEDEDLPRSSVRARRIVRAADLDRSTSDEDDEDEDNDANTEDVNDADITDQAKTVLSKTPTARGHNFLHDLHHRQLGRGHLLRPSFNQRQVSSLDMVRRLHMVSKLSGHEGCVNSLGFNTTGTKIASGRVFQLFSSLNFIQIRI